MPEAHSRVGHCHAARDAAALRAELSKERAARLAATAAADAARAESARAKADAFKAAAGAAADAEAERARAGAAPYAEADRARALTTAVANMSTRIKEQAADLGALRAKLAVAERDLFKARDELDRSGRCLACEVAPKDVLYLPCKHLNLCEVCHKDAQARAGDAGVLCPICRTVCKSSIIVQGQGR
jgi:multidrug efflux pump subunit AcrA (membrane-fusion protein)